MKQDVGLAVAVEIAGSDGFHKLGPGLGLRPAAGQGVPVHVQIEAWPLGVLPEDVGHAVFIEMEGTRALTVVTPPLCVT